MSVRAYGPVLLTAFLVFGCSKNSSEAQTPSGSQGSGGGGMHSTTIAIPANKDVSTKLEMPPNTFAVNMKTGAAAFTCGHLMLLTQKGRNPKDQYFDLAEPVQVPAHLDSTDSRPRDSEPFVVLIVQCHGGASDSQLVVTPKA